MTPRTEVVFIEVEEAWDEVRELLIKNPYARFPVYEGQLDAILGVLDVRDVMVRLAMEQKVVVRDILRPVIFLPETITALDALEYIARECDRYGCYYG